MLLQSFMFGLFICLGTFCSIFLWRRRRLYYLAAKIPGPNGLPLLGEALRFYRADCKKVFDIIMTMPLGYSTIMKAWLGPELMIYACTPKSLQIVLNSQKCMDKPLIYNMLFFTKGLLISGGQLWKRHRKILNPSFNISIIQQQCPTFEEKSVILIKNLRREVGKKQFDIYGYVSACSLETLLKTTMEIDRDIQSDPHGNKYLHDVDIGAQTMMVKMINVVYHIKPIYRFTNLYQLEQKHIHNGLVKLADEVLEEKHDLWRELEAQECDDPSDDRFDNFTRKTKSYIKTLIYPRNCFGEDELKDEINTLIAAGHETSALIISSTLLMLAMHPTVQEKAVQELKEVYGSTDASIDFESLNKLVYLDMVVKETLRLFPVLPISARQSTDEFQIGEYTIPSGATIVISTFTVQRNKLYWGEDADRFRPERFEPESFEKIHPYAFIPFTGGPRICIGWRYAMLFMKSILANCLRHYEVSTTLNYESLEFELMISMKIVQRCMVSLKTRNF